MDRDNFSNGVLVIQFLYGNIQSIADMVCMRAFLLKNCPLIGVISQSGKCVSSGRSAWE